MSQNDPKISIVTPSYNQGRFIEDTILSVVSQSYGNREYIVIDGGSTDGSVDIIKVHAEKIDNWVSEPDDGQIDAIVKGFKAVTGNVWCWLNSDDSFMPGALETVARSVLEHPDAVAWVGGCQLVDERGRRLRTVMPQHLTRRDMADWGEKGWFFQPSCFFKADAYRKAGGLTRRFSLAFDVDLWLRLAEIGPFVAIDQVLSKAVIHDEAKTQQMRNEMKAEHIMIQAIYGFDDIAKERINEILDQAWFFQTSRLGRLIARFRR